MHVDGSCLLWEIWLFLNSMVYDPNHIYHVSLYDLWNGQKSFFEKLFICWLQKLKTTQKHHDAGQASNIL